MRNIEIAIYFIRLRGLNELVCIDHLGDCYLLTKCYINICCYYYHVPGTVLYNGKYSSEQNREGPSPYGAYILLKRERLY